MTRQIGGDVDPALVARGAGVLRAAPAGLITDIDGTISPIAPTPAEAVVAAEARAALARLAARLDVVAVVSGRAADACAAMVGLPDLLYFGNHGMERRQAGETAAHPAAAGAERAVGAALAEIEGALAGTPLAATTIVENKRLTGTVHYRLAADPAAARAALAPMVAAAAARHGLTVTEGRAILELRPDIAVNKGTAIVDLARERGLRGAVFLGDDLTDVDGFRALRSLRERGELAALCVGVVGPETPSGVRDAVDGSVDGVAGCAAWLTALADRLDGRRP
ncbi:MAG TPA: trehalose-phosphatase [Thermomicrobiales bacterium]|nr:trehalose-phosphatase [Thermomicrobiales bacterium]